MEQVGDRADQFVAVVRLGLDHRQQQGQIAMAERAPAVAAVRAVARTVLGEQAPQVAVAGIGRARHRFDLPDCCVTTYRSAVAGKADGGAWACGTGDRSATPDAAVAGGCRLLLACLGR
ncbi:hypothetical protein [Xanthomonas theicola]|uniref:hypothetical protein n=1 Tax=Xanthomonas theicola TaxID=56464 RepID=UPI001FE88DA5|nr:hypothetical protein [Xanthomonas theicola]